MESNGHVELPPGDPGVWSSPVDPNPESTLSPAAAVDFAGPLPKGLLETLGTAQSTMLNRSYGLRISPQQFLYRIQVQVVPSNVSLLSTSGLGCMHFEDFRGWLRLLLGLSRQLGARTHPE